MADIMKVIILGIVEGITEFLPISSTGHLLVAASLLDFRTGLKSTFEVFIQLGAVFAVIVFYRHDLLHQITHIRTDPSIQRLWRNVTVAFIPAGVVGFLLNDWIKASIIDTSANTLIIAAALIVGGIIFQAVERRPAQNTLTHDLSDMTLMQALWVGIVQVTALIPGVSRSGASIIGGMLYGLDREAATRFSFYLAIPTLGIATLYDLLTNLEQLDATNALYLALGTLVSAVVAWYSIGWLLRYVARSSLVRFGYYRVAAGIVILLLIALRVLPT